MRDHYKENAEKAELSVLMRLQKKLCELTRHGCHARAEKMNIGSRLRALPSPRIPEDLLAKLEGDMITFSREGESLACRKFTIVSRVATGFAVLLVMMTVALACVAVADITPRDPLAGLVAGLTPRDPLAGEEIQNDMTTLYPKCARCFHDSGIPKGPIKTSLSVTKKSAFSM